MNAASLTSTHDVAYELFELRSGEGLRPIHRLGNRSPEGTVDSAQREFRDVLAKARGDDGARKRANIRALQSQLKEHWAPVSYNWRELERCLKVISYNLCVAQNSVKNINIKYTVYNNNNIILFM